MMTAKTVPAPDRLIEMADKRIMGPAGDNAHEATLRACAQEWLFDQQESSLRLLRAKQAEERLAVSEARVEALKADNMKWRRIINEHHLGILAPVLPSAPPSPPQEVPDD
jgi:hypothetical protein